MSTLLPSFALVRQTLTDDTITAPYEHTRAELEARRSLAAVSPGMRVAVGVGSRGIGCIRPVVTAVLDALRDAGAQPFLVPAMGSHGGGTAAGQRDVLAGYGLGVEATGVPIESDMEAVQIGAAPNGMPVYFDRFAAEADGILVVNRIKPHTSFRARWESGLMKMLAVGLGKRQGAATYHAWGIGEAIPAAAGVVLQEMPVLGGVAIVENGHHRPAQIEAVPAAGFAEREPELLADAWRHLPRIPLHTLDLLILQEIGKDISGTGMDLNIVGMWRRAGGPVKPAYRRVVVLDLTPNSHGNGIGVGYADVIPQHLYDKIDWQATYTNCLTSSNYNGAKAPITLPTERDAILAALTEQEWTDARVVVARNTLDLEYLWVSEPLLSLVSAEPALTVVETGVKLAFDGEGRLQRPAFPHAA